MGREQRELGAIYPWLRTICFTIVTTFPL
jgi:hypothetical protein